MKKKWDSDAERIERSVNEAIDLAAHDVTAEIETVKHRYRERVEMPYVPLPTHLPDGRRKKDDRSLTAKIVTRIAKGESIEAVSADTGVTPRTIAEIIEPFANLMPTLANLDYYKQLRPMWLDSLSFYCLKLLSSEQRLISASTDDLVKIYKLMQSEISPDQQKLNISFITQNNIDISYTATDSQSVASAVQVVDITETPPSDD